jgi:hypothetical protein
MTQRVTLVFCGDTVEREVEYDGFTTRSTLPQSADQCDIGIQSEENFYHITVKRVNEGVSDDNEG